MTFQSGTMPVLRTRTDVEVPPRRRLQAAGPLVLEAPRADNRIRWQPGERLDHLFEACCDRITAGAHPDHPAVVGDTGTLSFRDLDRRANQLARHLLAQGHPAGARIGLLVDRSAESYVAMLGVMKANMAYVALDPAYPKDRIAFILEDSETAAVVTEARYRGLIQHLGLPVISLDDDAAAIAAQDGERLGPDRPEPVDQLCYIVYTSGSTGRPKGVPIEHASICNFVRVAAEVYGYRPDDRVYQGMTIAFDFSVEEIWVPLLAGATLVPGPVGISLVGADLAGFLRSHHVTALCCVPTLLATIDEELPELRFLLVSGEACPQDLIDRWSRPGRTLINAYGPTEATVTATISRPRPDRPVTIGVPLPTYKVAILHPTERRALPQGAIGEICLAGVGLSRGYLNREEQTRKVFIDDFLGLDGNPSGKLYRTGDLGRVNEAGEIEYLGRIDTQLKIRGYRIEPMEIEAILMQVPEIAQAVVHTCEPRPGAVELVAYYTLREGVSEVSHDSLFRTMRAHLPSYMVPAFYERLAAIPMLPSHKADRKSLPPPAGPRHAAARNSYEPAVSETEMAIVEVLGDVLALDQISVNDHFFDDLGANSLAMAQVCARVKERLGLSWVSMKDTYMHPNVRLLALHIDATGSQVEASVRAQIAHVPSTLSRVLCGAGQAAIFALYLWWTCLVIVEGLGWVLDVTAWDALYGRSAVCGAVLFASLTGLPVALKWLLVGRWSAACFPVWSLAYLRFWVVKTLVRANPMVAFAGTPLYNAYLRALGARIGRGAVIESALVPVCTDLVEIGNDAVVRRDAMLATHRAEAGRIVTGPIRIGAGAYVGQGALLDTHTTLGEGSELGHASSLLAGQVAAAGRRYHGTPAVETETQFRLDATNPASSRLAAFYTFGQIAMLVLVQLPLPVVLAILAARSVPETAALLVETSAPLTFLGAHVGGTLALYLASLGLGLAVVTLSPRLLGMLLARGRAYPLYGLHYGLVRAVTALSNSKTLNILFGDSSYIVYYLRAIGWNVSDRKQTGSNFGLVQKHDIPELSEVGAGSIVSDGLAMANVEMSASAFRLGTARIGADNFVGNSIIYPPGGRTGDNCLLATKVMVPIDGPIRENVGLLGSPAFEIPRSVRRDMRFDHLRTRGIFEERLRLKNRANLRTMGEHLVTRWVPLLAASLTFSAGVGLHDALGSLTMPLCLIALMALTHAWFVLIERWSLGFGRMSEQYCSIYDPYYWWHERYWKLNDTAFITLLNGTPFKPLVWRLLGVRIGRGLFDDGCSITERTLVEIGDDVTLGEMTTLQSHSLEDGAFKSGMIRIGSSSTVASRSYVSFGVQMGEGVLLDPDSFLMKGETLPEGSHWRGNPARQIGKS